MEVLQFFGANINLDEDEVLVVRGQRSKSCSRHIVIVNRIYEEYLEGVSSNAGHI